MRVLIKLTKQSLVVSALVLPWLNPFAPGPSPAVVPWLVTLACVAWLLLSVPWPRIVSPSAVAGAWLVAALISSAMALSQYFGVEHLFSPWMNLSDGQAYANLRQRNQFASLSLIGLLALRWWVQRAGAVRWARVGAPAAVVLLACGTAASASRTGLVGLLLVACLTAQWGRWRVREAGAGRARGIALAALGGYALAAWLLPWLAGLDPARSGILARFAGDGCGSRLLLWRNVLELIAQRPWAGWGWGELDYAHFMHLYDGPRFCEILGNAHNLPLHLAVELGVPLAVLFCAALLAWVWRARPWREPDATRQLAWGVLAVLALHSLLEYPLWYGPFLLAVLLCLALLHAAPAAATPRGETVSGRQAALALLLLAAVGYAAWDYRRVSQIYLPVAQRAPAYRGDTLGKLRGSWLFRDQVQFAELSLTPLSRANAEAIHTLAQGLLHYSPEARVVEKLIESAVLLGREEEALVFLARYRVAYPQAYARWSRALNEGSQPARRMGAVQGKHLEEKWFSRE